MNLSDAIERGAAIAADHGITGKSVNLMWEADENDYIYSMCALGYAATGIVGHMIPVKGRSPSYSAVLKDTPFNDDDVMFCMAANDRTDQTIPQIVEELRKRETQRSN